MRELNEELGADKFKVIKLVYEKAGGKSQLEIEDLVDSVFKDSGLDLVVSGLGKDDK